MDIYKIIVLRRDDLAYGKQTLEKDDLTLFSSFNGELTRKRCARATFIIFVDSPNDYIILKNRNTDDSKETYALLDYLKLNHD